jgi:hypothetical protein
MIKKRNQLLHGVSNHKTLQEYNIEFDIAQMYKENLIYYHLIYYLILKIIGYDGAIMNIRALDYVQKITKEDISRSYIILT